MKAKQYSESHDCPTDRQIERALHIDGAQPAYGPPAPLPKGRWAVPACGRMFRCPLPDRVLARGEGGDWYVDHGAARGGERVRDPLSGGAA